MHIYNISLVFYIFAFLFLLINFYFNKKHFKAVYSAFFFLAIALNALQFLEMESLSFSNFIAMATLSMAAIYIFVNIKLGKPYLGLFLLPCIIACGLVALFFGNRAEERLLENIWLYIHIPLAIMGMAFFLTAFASGIVYFILEKEIKEKKLGKFFERFPSLAGVDKINSAALFLGFAFYTTGLLAAIGWMCFRIGEGTFSGSFYIKFAVAILAWVVTSAIALVKLIHNTTARQQAFASVIGVTSVVLTYAAVTIFMLRS